MISSHKKVSSFSKVQKVSTFYSVNISPHHNTIVSNSIWAFATVGFGAASNAVQMNTNNDYVSLQSDRISEDRELVTRILNVVAKSAMERLPRFRPQELNNLSWGFCRLGHHGDSMDILFNGIGQELLKRHYYFKPQVSYHI